MHMLRDAFDEQFQKYREHLRLEINRFCDCASVYRQISERTKDYLPELNLAPAFFRTVEDALFTTIVLWADKLFDEKGERGLFNFLTFVEYGRKWMAPKELQRRRQYPDDHWMLQGRTLITARSIELDRERIRSLAALKSIRIRRDKFHGHFDKDYFFDRSRLKEEAPLQWKDLDDAADVMRDMLNKYSAEFDGQLFASKTMNIADLTVLLRAARNGKVRHRE